MTIFNMKNTKNLNWSEEKLIHKQEKQGFNQACKMLIFYVYCDFCFLNEQH